MRRYDRRPVGTVPGDPRLIPGQLRERDRRGMHGDERLARPGGRRRRLLVNQLLGSAASMRPQRHHDAHRGPPSAPAAGFRPYRAYAGHLASAGAHALSGASIWCSARSTSRHRAAISGYYPRVARRSSPNCSWMCCGVGLRRRAAFSAEVWSCTVTGYSARRSYQLGCRRVLPGPRARGHPRGRANWAVCPDMGGGEWFG